jgi:hypothetical protein
VVPRLVIRYQENPMNTELIEISFLHLLLLLMDGQQQPDLEKNSHGVVPHNIFAQKWRRTCDADTVKLKVLAVPIVSYGGELRSARLPSAVIVVTRAFLSEPINVSGVPCSSHMSDSCLFSSVKRFVLFSASTGVV